mgnify:CR=1 FL=1
MADILLNTNDGFSKTPRYRIMYAKISRKPKSFHISRIYESRSETKSLIFLGSMDLELRRKVRLCKLSSNLNQQGKQTNESCSTCNSFSGTTSMDSDGGRRGGGLGRLCN